MYVDPEWLFQFKTQVIIKDLVRNDQVTAIFYNCHFYYRKEAKNGQFSVLVMRMDPESLFQFQKQVIIKSPVKNDQVTTLLYNCHFYYRKEAHKYPVFYSGCIGGSRMMFSIPKKGYNKHSSKN